MNSVFWFVLAAVGEISGCFSFWAWLRMGKSVVWTVPGTGALLCFAVCLTRVDSAAAGRAYAAYGGIYIVASVLWLWLVEGVTPDRWDVLGTLVCLCGAAIIFYGWRATV
jgi:small multidrug resistance family-3 protein